MPNPFSLTFGQPPKQLIDRPVQKEQILEDFTSETSPQMVYVITGVRGSGKTVLMTQIADRLAVDDETWITVELNSEMDLLQNLVAELYDNPVCRPWFQQAEIRLPFIGLELGFSQENSTISYGTTAKKMISSIQKHRKRLLIAVDEATNSKQMRIFAAEYQIWLRKGLPVYLLMTGLYDNIYKLQNEPSMTFLYRAPKVHLPPLNLGVVASRYASLLHLQEDQARQMALLTKGYPYAFQVLGYYTWKNDGNYQASMEQYKLHLDSYVYDKIWSELSAKDQKVLHAVASANDSRVKSIRELLSMEDRQFSPYRERLIRKGLVESTSRGTLELTLPLFREYILYNYMDNSLE